MKTELIELSTTQREIKVEIEPDAVKEVYNRISKKIANKVDVPGFRKGMAPVDVVRLRFKDDIRNEVLQELLAPKVTQAIQEHEITPLSEPQIQLENAETIKLNGSEPVVMRVYVEIMPEIPTPEYEGLEAVRRIRPVEDGEIDNIIEERRQQYSSLIPVEDRASEDGDTVIVDLEGAFSEEPDAEPIKANDLEVTLGDDLIEKSFSENLAGVKEDDVKEFSVTYPDDFTSPALAGKTLNYKAQVKSVGKIELPELDDEWVQSLDEGFDTVESLRSKLREDMETMAEAEADSHVRNDLIAKLIEKHEFEVPNALIDLQAKNLLNNFGQDLAQKGVDLEKVEKSFIEMAYSQMRVQAESDVRGAMLLDKVAELENAQVTSDEIAEEIERMADYYGVTPEEIRASLSQQQGGEENIANSLRTRKAVEALSAKAKITDGEWVDETHSRSEADAIDLADGKAEPETAETEEVQEEAKAEKKEKPKKKSAKKE